jgi:hypothetical protein
MPIGILESTYGMSRILQGWMIFSRLTHDSYPMGIHAVHNAYYLELQELRHACNYHESKQYNGMSSL